MSSFRQTESRVNLIIPESPDICKKKSPTCGSKNMSDCSLNNCQFYTPCNYCLSGRPRKKGKHKLLHLLFSCLQHLSRELNKKTGPREGAKKWKKRLMTEYERVRNKMAQRMMNESVTHKHIVHVIHVIRSVHCVLPFQVKTRWQQMRNVVYHKRSVVATIFRIEKG